MKVAVIGAGPAGVMAALRAAELGASTTLLTRDAFGGMAAGDGPIPVRTLAHAARLMRAARELERYGIATGEPRLDYSKLLARVREVVSDVREQTSLRAQADRLGVTIHEHAGTARLLDSRTIQCEHGLQLEADRIILCAGGKNRRLTLPGSELTATHSDAWSLTEIPASLLVVGGGMTGLQVASIFHAFGTRVQVFQRGPRILTGEDEDVSAEVAKVMRASGILVHESFGEIDGFERGPDGIRMRISKDAHREVFDASLVVVAVGWEADTAGLDLAAAGVEIDERGFVRTDEYLATSCAQIFAAGDITGRSVLVPQAVLDAHAAATNAVSGRQFARREPMTPMGGFTDPEYAHVGLSEIDAANGREIVVGTVRFEETARTIIDGCTTGFCKLIADRRTRKILGCHVLGERAADIVQAVSMAMAAGLGVDEVARFPLAFPTYIGMLSRAAYRAAVQIEPAIVSPAFRAGF